MHDSDAAWEKVLHPETLRGNLVAASLFIAAYEVFKDRVVERPRWFFSAGFDENGFIVSDDYETDVLSRSRYGRLHASLLWFQHMDAIDEDDIEKFARVKAYRNSVVHELPEFLTDAKRNLDQAMLADLLHLLSKIEKWWVINIEAEIDPDIVPDGVALHDVVPGSILSIQLMLDIASGNEPEPGYYYKAFNELRSKRT